MDLTQKSIWKFPIDAVDLFGVDMPEGAEILSVQVQNGTPCVWALVEPGKPKENRTFVICAMKGGDCDICSIDKMLMLRKTNR